MSWRSRSRRSSSLRWRCPVLGAWVLLAAVPSARAVSAGGGAGDLLVERLEGGTIDWSAGALSVTGAAAADLRMPSASSARTRAERAARVQATTRLGALLRELPLARGRRLDAAAVARAVARADGRLHPADVDYTSNGGAIVRLTVRFGDWAPEASSTAAAPTAGPAAADALVLSMATCRLQAAPTLVLPGESARPAPSATWDAQEARYRLASTLPAGVRAVRAHLDAEGRVVLVGKVPAAEARPARPIVIYCEKVGR